MNDAQSSSLLYREIVIKVAQGSRWSTPEIIGTRRTAELIRLRHLAMYLCRTLDPSSTLQEIAAHFGKKNHVTISHACDRIKHELANDKVFAKWATEVQASIRPVEELREKVATKGADEKTDLLALEAIGRQFDQWACARETPFDREKCGRVALLIAQAMLELRELRHALAEPVPGLEGTLPVVLFLRNEQDREELVRLLQQSNPNLRARNL